MVRSACWQQGKQSLSTLAAPSRIIMNFLDVILFGGWQGAGEEEGRERSESWRQNQGREGKERDTRVSDGDQGSEGKGKHREGWESKIME